MHDHLVNFEVFLRRLASQPLHELWIAGDLGTPETIVAVSRLFPGSIRYIPGNVEEGHDLDKYTAVINPLPNVIWSVEQAMTWQIDELSVVMSHRPVEPVRATDTSAQKLYVSGHTHRPHLKHIGRDWFLNPGTLAGVFAPATYVLAAFPGPDFRLRRLYT